MTDPLGHSANMGLRARIVVGLCVFAAVFLARAWLVLLAGSEVPFGDQWSGEARSIYEPFLDGTLATSDLFQPHNEHRIVFTHILNLGLLGLNGQWDPLVQHMANAVTPAATAGLLTVFLLPAAGRVERIALLFAILAIFCLPFGWENTFCGFQSCFHFSVLFGLGALGFLGLGRGRLWVAGLACATAGFLALGTSGAVGLALGSMGLVSMRDPGGTRRGAMLALFGALIFVAAALLKPAVGAHDAFRAGSFGEFIPLFTATLSWPLLWHPSFFLIANAPLGVLVTARLLRRIERTPLQDAAILTGVWAAAVGAGFALYRAGMNPGLLVVPSRYTDILCFLPFANLLALFALVRCAGGNRRVWSIAAACLWSVVILSGFAEITSISWRRVVQPRIESNVLRTQMITLFQRTGDVTLWDRFPKSVHPSGGPGEIERAMSNPALVEILPPGIHPGIPDVLAGPENGAFRAAPFPTGEPPPGFYAMRTSYSDDGRFRTGEFQSPPFEVTSAGIELTVTGQLPEGGGSVALVPSGGGAAVTLLADDEAVTGWITFRKRVPAGSYSLVVRSEREDGWISFSAPRPVGPLSMVVRDVRPFNVWFLVAAACMGLIAIAAAAWPPPRRDVAE